MRAPASRAVLLPLMLGQAINFVRPGSSDTVRTRLAGVMCEVCENDPDLLRSLPANGLRQAFEFSSTPVVMRRLFSNPAMARFLLQGGGPPVTQPSGPILAVMVAPSFTPGGQMIVFNSGVELECTKAQWREAGDPEGEWREISRANPFRGAAQLNLIIMNPPSTGQLTVRAEGHVKVGDLRSPFVWQREYALKPRAELVLTEAQPNAQEAEWIRSNLDQSMVTANAASGASRLQWVSDLATGTNLNNKLVRAMGTLLQGEHAWPGTMPKIPSGGMEALDFDAIGFDPTKPFQVRLTTDLDGLREQATGDSEYLPTEVVLHFEALDRPPTRVSPTDAPDSPR